MISFPSLVTLAPAELLHGESGCGAASRSRTRRRLGDGGWGGGKCGLVFFSRLEFLQEFPSPTKKKTKTNKTKLFTRDTARNYRAKLTSCLGEQQDPAPSRGTRKTGSAHAEKGGQGGGVRRTLRTPDGDGPRRRGHRRRRDAGRTSAALGRPPLFSPPSPEPGGGVIVSIAPAAPCARAATWTRSRGAELARWRPPPRAVRRAGRPSSRPSAPFLLVLEPSPPPAPGFPPPALGSPPRRLSGL